MSAEAHVCQIVIVPVAANSKPKMGCGLSDGRLVAANIGI
jgi:hypothetical protein